MTRHPRRRAAGPARHLLLLLATLVTALAGAGPAGAQADPAARVPAAVPPLGVRLLDVPAWAGPADTMQVVLEVTNNTAEPLTGVTARLAFFPPVRSRTELGVRLSERGLAARDAEAQDTFDLADILAPGETRTVSFAKPLAEVSFLRRRANRVFPVRVAVSSETIDASPVTVPFAYFDGGAGVPLDLALVIPLHTPTVYDENGLVVPSRLREHLLDGRISRILDGLQTFPGVPVTVAPSGLLLDTLADLADGYLAATRGEPAAVGPSDASAVAAAVLLGRIRDLAVRPQTRVVITPYSGARLPRLVAAGLTERAVAQVSIARERLTNVLGRQPLDGWLLPTHGEVDRPTLDALVASGVAATMVAPDSLVGRRESILTVGAPVMLPTKAGRIPGLVEDPGLAETLVPAEGWTAAQARQRFLGEAAALMLEQPGRRRAVVAVAPLDWAPGDAAVGGILDALGRSPYLRGTTPDMIVADPAFGSPGGAEVVARTGPAGSGTPAPPPEYFTRIRDAKRLIEQYADLRPPPDRILRMETNLLIAESADVRADPQAIEHGSRYVRAVEQIVRGEFAKIRAPEEQRITLTAHEGVIPIQVRSQVDYPVDVVVRLESDKLTFPDGMRLQRRLPPRGQNIEVRAIARTTGTFPVRVVLQTPERGVVLGASQLVVRSTAYNVVGLGITASAGIFLVAWWVAGLVRRRIGRPPAEAAA